MMPRIRSLKPEFWDSPDTAKASFRTRLLFMAMWNWADDYGVGDATPGRLVNFAFPHDGIPVAEFPRMLSEVSESYGVVFFTFRNRPFYVIPSWDTHQRNERRAKAKVELYEAAEAAIAAARGKNADLPTDSAESPPVCADVQTLEQGNRGTGEVGTGEQGKEIARATPINVAAPLIPAAGTFSVQLNGNKVSIAPDIRAVVHKAVPTTVLRSNTVRDGLYGHTQQLADNGASEAELQATLAEWSKRTDVYPGHLPHIYAELARKASGATTTSQAQRSGSPAPSDSRVARVQALKLAPETLGKELLA